MSALKPVEEHLAQCLATVGPLPPIDLALLDALDCILAEDVVAAWPLPAFDNSSMDGYAVTVEDVAGASTDRPAQLPVVADIPAGSGEAIRLTAGSAVRIMTGAPVPPGTGGVIPVEWTDGGMARVQIRRPVQSGENIRRIGEDVTAGEVVLEAGLRLGPAQISLLAAIGRARVRVRPRPRVVVLSTGSELVEPGRQPAFGQISESNGYALTAACLDVGVVAYRVGLVPDDSAELTAALEDQLVRADVIITSGGVSAGAYDTVKEVLSRLGTVSFDRVAMQPGMPQGFGTVGDGTPIFTLPGNPVSAFVSFEVFVRPALRKMLGEAQLHRRSVTARAEQGWRSPPGKRQYVRARISRDTEGGYHVQPVGGHGSHLVADLARATCLAVVGEEVESVRAGDPVRAMVLERARR